MTSGLFLYPQITSSKDAYTHLKWKISYEQEEVWIICLNSLKHPIKSTCVFIGTVDHIIIHPREIFRQLFLSNCSSYILCHSHPSGSPSPSLADIKTTERFQKISELMQLPMEDHIILSKTCYYSFLDNNLIQFD